MEQGLLGCLRPLALQVQVDEHRHLGPEHPGVEGLGQIVDRPGGIASQGLMRLPADGGQEDDGDVPAPLSLLDVQSRLEAVEARHLHVEQDHGEVAGEDTLERFVSRPGQHEVLPQWLEDLRQGHEVLPAVVDEENAGSRICAHAALR